MTMYCWYQTEPQSVWHLALASERANILRTKQPALMTCLDADNDFSTTLTADETQAVRYFGDYYADFDSETLESAIEQLKKYLVLLQSKDVDLGAIRLYATGGRGFHVSIPQAMFMPKVAPAGVVGLPHIYKEMSHALYVDDLDLRVYTAKKGRQFRCANVKRENGKFKVQITADEAFSMTVERYEQLCASPRNELPLNPPTFNPDLGLLYAQGVDKVTKAVAKRKNKKPASDALARFKGEWPETATLIFNGLGIKPDVGWNHISFQLAILASELGKSEDDLLAAASPLIEEHRGDSGRYNTPRKRREDLRTMYRYVNGSPLYEFSPGGILALLIPDVRANADISFGEYIPDDSAKAAAVAAEKKAATADPGVDKIDGEAPAAAADAPAESETVEVEEADDGRFKVNRYGMFVKVEDVFRRASHVGVTKPVSMRKLDRTHIGYEVNVFVDGEDFGRHHIPMSAFTSRASFNNWALSHGGSMTASDAQVGQLADLFRQRAKAAGAVTYAVEREGVDVITPPGCRSLEERDVIWASPRGVVAPFAKVQYRYHGHYSNEGMFKSDLMLAPDLTLDDEAFVTNLLKINTPLNLAKLLGWFSAAALTQVIRSKFNRFPICQVFGQAGAGKSMTVVLLNHMYYHVQPPRQLSVAGQTPYPIIVAVASSASIPVVFEEVKTRQINKALKDLLQSIFRSNYTADSLSRGSIGKDKAVREPTVTDFANAAPIVFVGEAIEDQAAILERCVVVAMSKNDRRGRDEPFNACLAEKHRMGRIGKQLALAALSCKPEDVQVEVDRNLAAVVEQIGKDAASDVSRAAFNLAIALTGLTFLRTTLAQVFGTKFDETIEGMRDALLSRTQDNIPNNMSEASRVLDTMARLTRHTDSQYQLIHGVDYTTSADGITIDLKVRNAYDKYVLYQRSLAMEVLFDSPNAFRVALQNYGGTLRTACTDNLILFDSPKAIVMRISVPYMDKEGVDAFKSP